MKHLHPHLLFCLGLSALIAACSDSETDSPPQPGNQSRAMLRSFDSEAAFDAAVREALLNVRDRYSAEDGDAGGGEGAAAGGAAGGAVGGSDSAAPDSDSGSNSFDFTTTNVQEAGVDEIDLVKNDGRYLYVSGADADGAAEDLRILSLESDASSATPVASLDLELGGERIKGLYLNDVSDKLNVVSSPADYYLGCYTDWDDGWGTFSQHEFTLSTVSVAEPSAPAVETRKRVSAGLVSSRLIGEDLIVATRRSLVPPGVGIQSSEAAWEQAVQDVNVADMLPTIANPDGSDSVPLVTGSDCLVIDNGDQGNEDWQPLPEIIALTVLDSNTLAVRDSACFIGDTETLYASPEAIYLATTLVDYENTPEANPTIPEATSVTGGDVAVPPVDLGTQTAMHRFAYEDGTIRYTGSGAVPGDLGDNPTQRPFRMSERDGVLRVATYTGQHGDTSTSPVTLTTLDADSTTGTLTELGQLPNESYPDHIGKPNELLYASRFIGDRAYLVTFVKTDPLYLFDLSDASNPRKLGELQITGYSDYLHPIDENHLIGLGRDAVPMLDDETRAWHQGLKLSLFDVTDPAAPYEEDSVYIGERDSYAEALDDHRAITIQPANEQHRLRMAFAVDVHGDPAPTSWPEPAVAMQGKAYNHTGLYGFEIGGNDGGGITRKGAMVMNDNGEYGYGSSYGDRGVIVNDAVYYVHDNDVWSANWSDLDTIHGPK
ncbi:MAG: hypothetical protein CSB44_04775 [Gammaproteobacteria bacterium]|nr:MAG: hypothetical protein CSB44_04775 [Gammaproteobacteria bacterium]